jgi:hypothetical protein
MVNIHLIKDVRMKGNGSVADAQVLALKHGQIMIGMKVILKMVFFMGKAN